MTGDQARIGLNCPAKGLRRFALLSKASLAAPELIENAGPLHEVNRRLRLDRQRLLILSHGEGNLFLLGIDASQVEAGRRK